MKRLVICLLMFAFVIGVASFGTVTVKKQSNALLQAIDKTITAMDEEKDGEALTYAKRIEAMWSSAALPLFVFLDHTAFSEPDLLLPHLSEYLSEQTIPAKEQLLRCRGILEDVLLHQRVSIGNIL